MRRVMHDLPFLCGFLTPKSLIGAGRPSQILPLLRFRSFDESSGLSCTQIRTQVPLVHFVLLCMEAFRRAARAANEEIRKPLKSCRCNWFEGCVSAILCNWVCSWATRDNVEIGSVLKS